MEENYDLDPNEIIQRLQDLIEDVWKKNDEYKTLGRAKALKTKTFNEEFAKKQMMLKNGGMAISILKAQTLGKPQISILKFNMDVSESNYLACREALHAMKEILGTYRSFLTWLRMEHKGQNIPRFHS